MVNQTLAKTVDKSLGNQTTEVAGCSNRDRGWNAFAAGTSVGKSVGMVSCQMTLQNWLNFSLKWSLKETQNGSQDSQKGTETNCKNSGASQELFRRSKKHIPKTVYCSCGDHRSIPFDYWAQASSKHDSHSRFKQRYHLETCQTDLSKRTKCFTAFLSLTLPNAENDISMKCPRNKVVQHCHGGKSQIFSC